MMKQCKGLCIGAAVAVLLTLVSTLPSISAAASAETIVEIDPLDPFARIAGSGADAADISDLIRRQRYGRRMKRNPGSKESKKTVSDEEEEEIDGDDDDDDSTGNSTSASRKRSKKSSKKSASAKQSDDDSEDDDATSNAADDEVEEIVDDDDPVANSTSASRKHSKKSSKKSASAKQSDDDSEDNDATSNSTSASGSTKGGNKVSKKGSKKSASAKQTDDDGVADFSAATAASRIFRSESWPRSDGILEVSLVLPDTPTDVFLLTDGVNPNRRGRKLEDDTELNCDDPELEQIYEDVTGMIRVLVPGDVDSKIILCNRNNVIGAFDVLIIPEDTPGPTSAPVFNPDTPAPTSQPDDDDDEVEEGVVTIDGADFSAATAAVPILENEFWPRSDNILEVPLVLPGTPTDVFLLTDGVNPNRRGRELEDITTLYCDNPEFDLIGEDVTGMIRVLVPGDVDSKIIFCNSNNVIGVYDVLIVADTPGPTSTPMVTPVTPAPTGTPVTPAPTGTPVTPAPTGTPVTPAPTGTPVTPAPTGTPVTSTPAPTPLASQVPSATPAAGGTEQFQVKTSASGYYIAFAWGDLPTEVQDAATILGYNQSSWNHDEEVSTSIMFWSQLTDTQQAAASVLLYSKASWNLEVYPLVTCELSESWLWADIPAELKWAVKAMGFTNVTWDTSDAALWPPSATSAWEALTESERDAAGYLGYDAYTWNTNCGA